MSKPFAIVTGASSGIGLELAAICAQQGFDLLIAADQSEIHAAAERCRNLGAETSVVEADLATISGVDQLWAATDRRPVDALLGERGPRPGPRVSRPGLCRRSARYRYQRHPAIYVNDNFGQWRSDFRRTVAHGAARSSSGRVVSRRLRPTKSDYFVLNPKHSGFYDTTLEFTQTLTRSLVDIGAIWPSHTRRSRRCSDTSGLRRRSLRSTRR